MHIKAFKMDMKPRQFLFIDRTLYLLTHSAIHIIDFKGDIKPDIPLQNVVLKKTKKREPSKNDNAISTTDKNKGKHVITDMHTSGKAINIAVRNIKVVGKYILVQSVDDYIYYVKIGETDLTRYCMKVEKVVYDGKMYFINDNCIFEASVTKLREYPRVVLVFPGKIDNLEIIDGKLLFFANRRAFLAEKTGFDYGQHISGVRTGNDSHSTFELNGEQQEGNTNKKGCSIFNFVEIGALSELEFTHTANNKRFVLLVTEDSIIVFSYNTEAVVLKRPDDFHQAVLVKSYVLIFSHKVLIYNAIDGTLVKEIALTAFSAVYDEISDSLVMYNSVLFCAHISDLLNGFDKEVEQINLTDGKEQNKRKLNRNTQNREEQFVQEKNIANNHMNIEESIGCLVNEQVKNDRIEDGDGSVKCLSSDEKTRNTVMKGTNDDFVAENKDRLRRETNTQKKTHFDTLIEHKLFKFAYPINPRQTFLHYSRCAYKSQNVLKVLFFYTQTAKKYSFNRSNVIELCQQRKKIDLMTHKVVLECDIADNMRVTVSDLIYFLCIRSVFMKKEINYLFYLFCILKMRKHQRNLLRFAIENELRIKLLDRIDHDELLNGKVEQEKTDRKDQACNMEMDELPIQGESTKNTSSAAFLSVKPLNEHNSAEKKENRFLITKQLSKKLVLQYWKIHRPEKAVLYYFTTEKYRKCTRILLKTHHKIPQLQHLLFQTLLFTKIPNVSVLKLYDLYFPDLLMLLTKHEALESLGLYFKHVIDPLKNSQVILKSVQRMDANECEMIVSIVNDMEMNESMKDFRETLEFVCNERKEVKGSIFKCSGKIINP